MYKELRTVLNKYKQQLHIFREIKGYTESDAEDTALDETILQVLKALSDQGCSLGKFNISETTYILKELPKHINTSVNTYAYMISNYLTYSLPSKAYLKGYTCTDKALDKGEKEAAHILTAFRPPITIIHSLNPNIYYSDYECSFLAAIGPIILSREFSDTRDAICKEWDISPAYIYLIDDYRKKRITEVMQASYDQKNGYAHLVEINTRKNQIISIQDDVRTII